MGGTIRRLRQCGWEWHIISVCNDYGDEYVSNRRRSYFETSCKELGARSTALDFHDYQDRTRASIANSVDEITNAIRDAVCGEQYDCVFTHHKQGEYGPHPNHTEVTEAVDALVSNGDLAQNVARFSYGQVYSWDAIKGYRGLANVADRKNATHYLQLTYDELLLKANLIRCHPLPQIVKNLQDDLGAPCPNPEAFQGSGACLPTPPFLRRKT